MKTILYKSMLMLLLTILCAFESVSQLNRGSLPSDRTESILAQRYRAIRNSGGTGGQELYFGTPDLGNNGNRRGFDFNYQPLIEFTMTFDPNQDQIRHESRIIANNGNRSTPGASISSLRSFLGNQKASQLQNINYIQIELRLSGNNNDNGQVTIENLELNGVSINETISVDRNGIASAYLLDRNLARGFTLTGRMRITGNRFNNSPEGNKMEISSGYFYDFTTLPLEFTSIKGFAENGQNRINFTTADNHEAKTFYIERSEDGMKYETIGQVATVNGRTGQYTFIDKTPLLNGFYRIRGVNILDRMVYSDVIRINQSFSTMRVINQVGRTEIIFSESKARNIKLFSFSGQLVKQINFNSNRHAFDHQGLQKGMYVMQVNGEAIKIMVL
ncbi:MAG: T9SS type A sorting domain-containing protein [Flavihumibacter sp.]|jgi:hypothetical protein|nr:T9SS type A sorting domain-containing protein [Flavihumibacter sp.]